MSTLSAKVTKYVNKIWKHKIKIDIEISDSLKCRVSIQDEGVKNEHNFHQMSARSEGFKQFISLILSLSIETKKLKNYNKLIIIDEPESHLHPSGIRDLRDELLEIGKDNYLFVSTHSPFLVDRKNKERNIIIKKNNSAITEKKEIKNEGDLRDDEVLDEAFGINIYKDLLTPFRILVEGASDRTILRKAFSLKGVQYGITNGAGGNIVQIASKLNNDEIDVLILVDDDAKGREYKQKILKIEGIYNTNNVFTLRDLLGAIPAQGTIEDLLGESYIKGIFGKVYKEAFGESPSLVFDDSPFVNQVKIFLQQNGNFSSEILEDFKRKISEDFNPASKTVLTKNFPIT